MSITCKICNKIFEKQITNSHLKTHSISTEDYKIKYGELSSSEYKQQLSLSRSGENNSNFGNKWNDDQKKTLSDKNKNKTPWNKDKKIVPSQNMINGILKREEKYKAGILTRNVGRVVTEQTKEVIRRKLESYSTSNKHALQERAKKAVKTKIKNGYDFGSNMRNKKHNEETKKLISEKSKINNKIKIENSFLKRLEYIKEANLTLLNEENKLVTLNCNTCKSVFSLTRQCFTESKFRKNWCQVCYPIETNLRSKHEIELFEFVKSLSSDSVNSNRQILSRKEVDIYVPKNKIAIEFNGLYWHSEDVLQRQGKSKLADYEKMKLLNSMNIKYIGVFEDEWLYKKEIVKSRIKNILGFTSNIIYGRKCTVKEITSTEASIFCDNNHIQGRGRSNARYGLFYNDELVSVMTFSKTNLSRKIIGWEINRFCNKLNTSVIGGASKLFSAFVKNYSPDSVISYADSRWSEGNLYKTLNFSYDSTTKPNYWYFLPNELRRIHRFSLRKTENDDKNLTENELRQSEGYMKIWDCGNTKWIWKKGH